MIDLDERNRIEKMYREEHELKSIDFLCLKKFLPLTYICDNTNDRFFRYEITDCKRWVIAKIKYGINATEYDNLQH